MIRTLSLLLFVAGFLSPGLAQEHWVFFKDKGREVGNAELDSAIYPLYKNRLEKRNGLEVIGYSKWLNAACVSGDVKGLKNKGYISNIQPVGQYKVELTEAHQVVDTSRYGSADVQLQMIGLDKYHQLGHTGKGIRIGVFDAGFRRMNDFAAFDSLWMNGQIIDHYDFVRKDTLRFNTSMHGTSVLSIMGINYPDSLMGAAPHSSFVLARTEDGASETHVEEYNWIKALEWADSVGVDIIHSSLGYSLFDSGHFSYTYEDMDGQTTLITLATDIAASKGIFVTNSAGNSGAQEWRFITAPCDGKQVLCIGAVDSFERKADFSSFGPSADGRVKPEVMAMGHNTAHISNGGLLRFGSGTSFSGPLIAGMVACMMEANPRATNEQIFQAIIRSADRYQMPDSGYGYGLPNVMRADTILKGIILSAKQAALPAKPSIYPNPASGFISIRSEKKPEKISVFAIDGREMITVAPSQPESAYHIDLQNLTQGTYIVQTLIEEQVFRQKIVIVH